MEATVVVYGNSRISLVIRPCESYTVCIAVRLYTPGILRYRHLALLELVMDVLLRGLKPASFLDFIARPFPSLFGTLHCRLLRFIEPNIESNLNSNLCSIFRVNFSSIFKIVRARRCGICGCLNGPLNILEFKGVNMRRSWKSRNSFSRVTVKF